MPGTRDCLSQSHPRCHPHSKPIVVAAARQHPVVPESPAEGRPDVRHPATFASGKHGCRPTANTVSLSCADNARFAPAATCPVRASGRPSGCLSGPSTRPVDRTAHETRGSPQVLREVLHPVIGGKLAAEGFPLWGFWVRITASHRRIVFFISHDCNIKRRQKSSRPGLRRETGRPHRDLWHPSGPCDPFAGGPVRFASPRRHRNARRLKDA